MAIWINQSLGKSTLNQSNPTMPRSDFLPDAKSHSSTSRTNPTPSSSPMEPTCLILPKQTT
jgi:hypothetical protein